MDVADQNHFPRRLRRLSSFDTKAYPIFFLTICMASRVRILAQDNVHRQFVVFCEASPTKANVWVGKYVLMPDHIHIFVSAAGPSALSRWVGSLKKFLAAHWRREGLRGPFWQAGFFDHILRNSESYSEKWAYIEANPVRAGLVKENASWKFAGEIHRLNWW